MRLCVLILMFWLAMGSARAGLNDTLNIGILSMRDMATDQARWQPLADYLQATLPDVRVNLQVTDFAGLDAGVQSRQLDVIITDPASYLVYAHRIGLSAPLASLVEKAGDRPVYGFGGTILVKQERSELQSLSSLKGRRIAIIETLSFGGYQAQAYELSKVGVHLPQDAELVRTGQPYDAALAALLTDRADVLFARSGLYEAWLKEGKIQPGQLRVINPQNLPGFPYAVSTSLYPERPVAAMPQLDETLAKRVTAALLNLSNQHP